MAHIFFPLPSLDFDPTEVGVSWRVLTNLGHRVSFATPEGRVAQCDPIMLTGRGLDPWSEIPLLGCITMFGRILGANKVARLAYQAMANDSAFLRPLRWSELRIENFDAILLGGGHRSRGMRKYLESEELQGLILHFFAANKPVAAICHGVLLVARSKRPSGESVLYGRKTTSLLWAQERTASVFAHIGRFWDRNYYRTYLETPGQPDGYMSVQKEVMRALQRPEDFIDVPISAPDFKRKTLGLSRDTLEDDRPAWVVTDGNYVSARWPGDAHTFAKSFSRVLEQHTG